MKLTFKVVFEVTLLAIVCRAFDPKSFEKPENLDQPGHFDMDNAAHFPDFDDKFEDDILDEIKAIQGHMKYQDAIRDVLLKLSADLRGSRNITTKTANSFFKVIDGIEKEVAEFHAALRRRRVTNTTLLNLENFIKEAARDQSNNTKILRALTSQGMFLAERLAEDSSVRKRSYAGEIEHGARKFLNIIKKKIGTKPFEDFLSINGFVTLMFVIDDTGSMGDDIVAAQHISEQIVKARSKNSDGVDVDFILSPFNDPDTGPVTKNTEKESAQFLRALKSLTAHGGGDCAERGFTGMIAAVENGPHPGSPMYVFSDAPPKDATGENATILLNFALALDIKINFFLRHSCGAMVAYKPYHDVAAKTHGQVFNLKNTAELEELGAKIVDNSLGGITPISSENWGWATGRRRRSTDHTYLIPIDDSIEKLSILVTAQYPAGIKLINPTGAVVVAGIVSLSDGLIYNLESPMPGTYKLIVPTSAGKHKFEANGASKINIDFGYQYVTIAKRGTRIPDPLEQPLQGFPAKAFITIAGVEFVKPDSLTVKVIDDKGTVHAEKSLTAVGTSGVRYFVRFDPPSGPFKLQLHGQTRNSNSFVRESSSQDQTVPVLLKLSYREDSNILQRGKTTMATVKILRGDVSPKSQKYTLSLSDESGYGYVYRSPRPVYRGRFGFAVIKFNVPADAPEGKTETVKLSLTEDGKTSPVASLTFSFLFV